jgi:hypothetical protein
MVARDSPDNRLFSPRVRPEKGIGKSKPRRNQQDISEVGNIGEARAGNSDIVLHRMPLSLTLPMPG